MEQPWVEAMLQRFEEKYQNSDQIEAKSMSMLFEVTTERLRSRQIYQTASIKTQERLDWIKVNGTGFGFLIGGIAGMISLMIEHLF